MDNKLQRQEVGIHVLKMVCENETYTQELTVHKNQQNRIVFRSKPIKENLYIEQIADIKIEMVFVAGGTFDMGDSIGDGESDERPVHSVTLDDFYIGKYEVTQAQWRAVIGESHKLSNPSTGDKCDNCPVEWVSWNDIQEFLKKLNQLTNKTYRLPTEAEWEYAAKGGSKSKGYRFSGGDNAEEVSWCMENSDMSTKPVGLKKPNEQGIYDLTGNVREWCNDWYSRNYYSESEIINPKGAETGSYRVVRGGSWRSISKNCRISDRSDLSPSNRSNDLGFRLCLVL